jgi:two-component system, LytTR family, response regulator
MSIRSIVVDDEDLARQRLVELVRADSRLEFVGGAEDGRSALDLIVEEQPALVFLDIQMPELDGFQVISALDESAMPAVIFVTAYDEYALRAFDVNAIDYLLKPVTADRFAAAVSRAIARGAARDAGDTDTAPLRALASRATADRGAPVTRFVARRGAKHYFVSVADIDWIESDGNYVRLHTGQRSHLIRETMKGVEARLDPAAFVRVHRSAIIAVDRAVTIEVRRQGEYLVTMRGGVRITSSRAYSERVRALIR